METNTPAGAHNVQMSAYVDAALADLVARFASPDAPSLVAGAIEAALGAPSRVRVVVDSPRAVSATTGRVGVTWAVDGPSASRAGPATITLLLVQSGGAPLTELLVSIPAGPDVPTDVAPIARRVVDELAARLS